MSRYRVLCECRSESRARPRPMPPPCQPIGIDVSRPRGGCDIDRAIATAKAGSIIVGTRRTR